MMGRILIMLALLMLCGAAISAKEAPKPEAPKQEAAEASVALATAPVSADIGSDVVANVISRVKKGVIRVNIIPVDQPFVGVYPGGGTGFVFQVDYDQGIAYAITNHHVSGHAMLNQVMFWNDAQYKAELVATEPGIDVALLKIYGIPDERNLPDSEKTIVPCVLGDSDQVQIGEMGIAMGNPGASEAAAVDRSKPYEDFLLKQTATVNVIAGRDTPIDFEIDIWSSNRGELGFQYGTNLNYAFRMATPISPGNSGGPLFNSKGEVIGINFYGGNFAIMQNSNHAVPINLAKDFVFQILETGKFEKSWLGLDIIMPPWVRRADQYEEFRERYQPDRNEVYGVRPDSPAEEGGFKKGDVIVTVDGQKFKSPEDIRLYIFDLDIGAEVTFEIMRKGAGSNRYKELKDPIVVKTVPKRSYNAEFSV